MHSGQLSVEAWALDPVGQKLHQRVRQCGIAMDTVRSSGTRTPHQHTCLEIVLVHSGTTVWSVQGHSHIMVPGDILVFNAQSLHSSRPVHGQYLRTGIHFLPELVPASLLQQLPGPTDAPWRVSLPPASADNVLALFQRLRMLTGTVPANKRSQQLLGTILGELTRLFFAPIQSDPGDILLRKIAGYMIDNRHQEESSTSLAQRFYVSEGHLFHLFRTRFGCSPKRLWQFIKIESICASQQLIHSNVDQLAQLAGFQTRRGFERAFLRVKGMPVSGYRTLLSQG